MTEPSTGKLIVQLHNFSSVNLSRNFVTIATGIGAKEIIFSKASGQGASSGVPIAQKKALSKGVNFMVLQDIDDTLELLKPDEVYLFIRKPYSEKDFDPESITRSYLAGKTILLVFGGSEPGLTKRELNKGTPVYFGPIGEIGCLGEITLALYLLRKQIEKTS